MLIIMEAASCDDIRLFWLPVWFGDDDDDDDVQCLLAGLRGSC